MIECYLTQKSGTRVVPIVGFPDEGVMRIGSELEIKGNKFFNIWSFGFVFHGVDYHYRKGKTWKHYIYDSGRHEVKLHMRGPSICTAYIVGYIKGRRAFIASTESGWSGAKMRFVFSEYPVSATFTLNNYTVSAMAMLCWFHLFDR